MKVENMQITILEKDASTTGVELKGRLDAVTAPELELALQKIPDQTKAIIIDSRDLDYISSAGLRVFLALAKQSKQTGLV